MNSAFRGLVARREKDPRCAEGSVRCRFPRIFCKRRKFLPIIQYHSGVSVPLKRTRSRGDVGWAIVLLLLSLGVAVGAGLPRGVSSLHAGEQHAVIRHGAVVIEGAHGFARPIGAREGSGDIASFLAVNVFHRRWRPPPGVRPPAALMPRIMRTIAMYSSYEARRNFARRLSDWWRAIPAGFNRSAIDFASPRCLLAVHAPLPIPHFSIRIPCCSHSLARRSVATATLMISATPARSGRFGVPWGVSAPYSFLSRPVRRTLS